MGKRKYETEEEAKEAKKVRDAKWYQKNKGKKAAYNAERYQANKEEILAKRAEWRQDNPDYIAEYYKTLFGMCACKSGNYHYNDRKYFGTDEGSVTAEQMKEMIEAQPHCFYCGCEDLMQLGLDRIDNDRPHTVDNCVVACWKCNKERKRMPFKEFCTKKGLTI